MQSSIDTITVFNIIDNVPVYFIFVKVCMIISALTIFIGLGCFVLRLKIREKKGLHRAFSNGALYMVSVGLIGFLVSIPINLMLKSDFNTLAKLYKNKHYKVVEGVVNVIYEQPKSGHDKGDIIKINGKEFEINYFVMTHAYSQTIAHGGVLKEGVYAKVFYYDDKILRIDVKESQEK